MSRSWGGGVSTDGGGGCPCCPRAKGPGLTCLGWGEEGEAGEAVAWDAGAARGEHGAQGLQSGVQRPLRKSGVPPPSGLVLPTPWGGCS